MMILEHGDMGCGCAQLFHMPLRGAKRVKGAGNYDYEGIYSSSTKESLEEYKERFLGTTLKQRRLFSTHANQTMCSDDFTVNGVMKDGTTILHLRTVRDWLFEYHSRPMTMIMLGQGQTGQELDKVLLDVGFTLQGQYPNPIMGFQPVSLFVFPAISKDDYVKKSATWRQKLVNELEEYTKMGIAVKPEEVNRSKFTHDNFNI